MTASNSPNPRAVAFIGSAGVPNRYGGFEAFLEHCTPRMAEQGAQVLVTCDARLYPEGDTAFGKVRRVFLRVPANGAWSVLHDLLAFLAVLPRCRTVVVLGVSGGPWFPLMRLLCSLSGKRLVVNVDGVEWQRNKFGSFKRRVLKTFDALAQWSAHTVVYDNPALLPFVQPRHRHKAVCIAYSGDHVMRSNAPRDGTYTALTVCRIEPENNIDLLIEGALASPLTRYTVVGNWQASAYGQSLRERHAGNPRLQLLDPVYDPQHLMALREACTVYLHGHSVGGTNPSLVEMLFYDCPILCFDVPFHRETAGDCAGYFATAPELAALLVPGRLPPPGDRKALRRRYSAAEIASQYLSLART